MIFNSFGFLIFLSVTFLAYWFGAARSARAQNVLILLASAIFYIWFDWRFALVLAVYVLASFWLAIRIGGSRTDRERRIYLGLNIAIALGLLCTFKYLNFLLQVSVDTLRLTGVHVTASPIRLLLPIGISFYAFQTLSYAIDVYRGTIEPTTDLVSYGTFVAFFAHVTAGPIGRAPQLLPQIAQPRQFRYEQAVAGAQLIVSGLFKKVVVADALAPIVDDVFKNYRSYGSLTLLVGSVGFAFQLYADFAGYTDVARGAGKLFGLELAENFRFPFFARSIPDFWARWHRSLSSWFNDYIFFPVAFALRQHGRIAIGIAVLLTFTVSGLWHGAQYTYVVWGVLYGLLYLPYIALGRSFTLSQGDRPGEGSPRTFGTAALAAGQIVMVFAVNTFVWTMFRSDSLADWWRFIGRAAAFSGSRLDFIQTNTQLLLFAKGCVAAAVFLTIDYLQSIKRFAPWWYAVMITMLLVVPALKNPVDFIYFHF